MKSPSRIMNHRELAIQIRVRCTCTIFDFYMKKISKWKKLQVDNWRKTLLQSPVLWFNPSYEKCFKLSRSNPQSRFERTNSGYSDVVDSAVHCNSHANSRKWPKLMNTNRNSNIHHGPMDIWLFFHIKPNTCIPKVYGHTWMLCAEYWICIWISCDAW